MLFASFLSLLPQKGKFNCCWTNKSEKGMCETCYWWWWLMRFGACQDLFGFARLPGTGYSLFRTLLGSHFWCDINPFLRVFWVFFSLHFERHTHRLSRRLQLARRRLHYRAFMTRSALISSFFNGNIVPKSLLYLRSSTRAKSFQVIHSYICFTGLLHWSSIEYRIRAICHLQRRKVDWVKHWLVRKSWSIRQQLL